jgi:hypothetical protein
MELAGGLGRNLAEQVTVLQCVQSFKNLVGTHKTSPSLPPPWPDADAHGAGGGSDYGSPGQRRCYYGVPEFSTDQGDMKSFFYCLYL